VSSLGAEAVTVGRDVFLAPGASDIASTDGQRALMHELVHAVQSPGVDARPPRGLSSPRGSTETEAASIGVGGLHGPVAAPTGIAPAGIAHRKVVDEEEEPKLPPVPDLLNPEPLKEGEQEGAPKPPKAGELGENEAIAFEIRVLAPLRGALAAATDTEWETAYNRMQDLGTALLEYEWAYEKRNPSLAAELRGIRGWLALAANQIKARFGSASFSDAHIAELLNQSTTDLEGVSKRLG
jgi:hypothetical protein